MLTINEFFKNPATNQFAISGRDLIHQEQERRKSMSENLLRKAQLRLLLITLLAGTLLSPAMAQTEQDDKADARTIPKTEKLLLGPYSLADVYSENKQRISDDFSKRVKNVPSEDDIIKSFNACQLYIVDQRVHGKDGSWQLVEQIDEFPKILVAGKLNRTWEPRKTQLLTTAGVSAIPRV